MAMTIEDIRREFEAEKRFEQGRDKCERMRRWHLLRGARGMAEQVAEGKRKGDLYVELGITQPQGDKYLALAKYWSLLPEDKRQKLEQEKRLLSLEQVAAIRKSKPKEEDFARLIEKTAEQDTPPSEIANQVPSQEDRSILERLGITDEEADAAEREVPKRPRYPATINGNRVVVRLNIPPTLPLVFAALSDPEVFSAVSMAIQEGASIHIEYERKILSGLAPGSEEVA